MLIARMTQGIARLPKPGTKSKVLPVMRLVIFAKQGICNNTYFRDARVSFG